MPAFMQLLPIVFSRFHHNAFEQLFYTSSPKSNKAVLRYLSPLSGRMTTIILPAFSGRMAISRAANAAASLQQRI
jgi:hypothetical protein